MADMNTKPLKPKASAVWLIENTTLSFEQIAEYTGLHSIEIQALADEEVGKGIIGEDPIKAGELSQEEIARCEKDESNRLKINHSENPSVKVRAKGPRYTPVSKRNDKPDAIAYLLKHHPELKDSQVCKLVGTTKPTINAVRDRTHPNSTNIRPRHPAEIGLCTFQELEKASGQARSLSLDLYDQWKGLEKNGQFRYSFNTFIGGRNEEIYLHGFHIHLDTAKTAHGIHNKNLVMLLTHFADLSSRVE